MFIALGFIPLTNALMWQKNRIFVVKKDTFNRPKKGVIKKSNSFPSFLRDNKRVLGGQVSKENRI
jgi:hypothetical protein